MTRRSTAFLAFGLIAAIAATAVAAPGQRLKTKSETVEVGGAESGSATARCKRGTKAISGAFEGEHVDVGPSPGFQFTQSSRTGGRGWTSNARNRNLDTAGDVTSYAYCRAEKVKSRTSTETLAPFEIETVTAKCKPGTKAVSGGFEADEEVAVGPFAGIRVSRKAGPRTWEVQAADPGDVGGDLTAQVNCREGEGLKRKRDSGVFANTPFELEAECKRGQRVVSGGFAGQDAASLRVFASTKVGRRGWRLDGLADGEVTAYAYCEKK